MPASNSTRFAHTRHFRGLLPPHHAGATVLSTSRKQLLKHHLGRFLGDLRASLGSQAPGNPSKTLRSGGSIADILTQAKASAPALHDSIKTSAVTFCGARRLPLLQSALFARVGRCTHHPTASTAGRGLLLSTTTGPVALP